MIRTEQLNYLTSVGAGQVAMLDCPLDRRYHILDFDIMHEVGGVQTKMSRADMESKIDWIRVIVNGVRIWDITTKSLLKVYEEKGYADFEAGRLPIYFAQPHRETLAAQERTALGTKGVNPTKGVKVEIKLASSVVAPNIRGVAEYDDYNEAPNAVVKYKEERFQIASTGSFTHKLQSPIDSYASMYFIETADGDIEEIELKHSNKTVHDLTRDDLSSFNKRHKFNVNAGVATLHLDGKDPTRPLPTGTIDQNGNIIPALKVLKLKMANANPVTFIEEMIGAVNVAV